MTDARALALLQAAACTYRIAFGTRAGQKVLSLHGAMPRDAGFNQDLCVNAQGFSLHAAVRCGALPSVRCWSNCAVTSHTRRWSTSACNATAPAKSC